MIKSVDPSAQILGPGDFVLHYQSDGIPGDGKKEHGGMGQGNYFLQRMRAYETEHHVRILDYFDEHYYPIQQDHETEAMRFESTRSLWDPTYREKNWYGHWFGAVELIPKFHRWVDQYYPGTKVSISEYGWGENDKLSGALIEADVLGIFGRERLDLACSFGPPKADQPAANAYRIYLNYDGHGGQFGDTSIRSTSSDQSQLAIYGSQRDKDQALTLIVINKTETDLTAPLTIAHFHAAAAKVFRYSKDDLTQIVPQPDQPITDTGFTVIFPAKSMTLFVISPGQ
jgi:hypothetical protein